MGKEQVSIPEVVEEVSEGICDKYCRFRHELEEEKLMEKCGECPLDRLGGF